MDAEYQKDRRDRIRKEKEAKRKLARIRCVESRARRKGFSFSSTSNVAIEAEATYITPSEVEGKEENEFNFHGAPPDSRWNVNDLVVLEDTRVGEPSKLFWETLAVVKSKRHSNFQWVYLLDDLDHDRPHLHKDVAERRLKDSKYSSFLKEGVRGDENNGRKRRREHTMLR